MLDLASSGSTRHTFAFAGAVFEVHADADVQWALSPEFSEYAAAVVSPLLAARVRCQVRVDPTLPEHGVDGAIVERKGEVTLIRAEAMRAEIRPLQGRRYEARVFVAADPRASYVRGPDAVVTAISAAVLEQHGGLFLHAAAIEVDGMAVLLVGPSGAGKSTAVELIEGARVFAYDRVSVAPDPSGTYMAWGLPGGTRVSAPASTRRGWPLAGLLRVRHGQTRPSVGPLRGARALFAIRESTQVTEMSYRGEELRMNSVGRFASGVAVGEIHTVLGAPHRKLLTDFLRSESSVYTRAVVAEVEGAAHVEV